MAMNRTTPDICRSLFKKCGHSYEDLTEQSVGMLAAFVNRELKACHTAAPTRYLESMYVSGISYKYGRFGEILSARILVSSEQFEDRQGVSFDRDYFIGLAEWADPITKHPIMIAFKKWCATFMAMKADIGERRWREARVLSFPGPSPYSHTNSVPN